MFDVLSLCVAVCFGADLLYRYYFRPRAVKARARKASRKLPKIQRAAARFALRYPDRGYEYGRGSYGIPEVFDFKQGSVLRIGSFCSIAAGVKILLGGHHRANWVTTWAMADYLPEAGPLDAYHFTRGDVVIGHDVWLCYGATILSGVTVGNGAIVSANAHVFKDVPPYAIVAGNPAQIIGWRFPEEIRQQLLDVAWWDWSLPQIAEAGRLLCSPDIQEFLAYAKGVAQPGKPASSNIHVFDRAAEPSATFKPAPHLKTGTE
ncbi:CatB-related O-acetyltransferase [Pseudomonas putida]